MDASETSVILEQWIARTAESYPRHAAALLSKEQDPFRNPVGDTLRRSLSQLLRELSGEMDATAIDSALDPIIRLQVVARLRFRRCGAIRISAEAHSPGIAAPGQNSAALDGWIDEDRIDRLAGMAADKYAQCREQLARIRANEVRRTNHVQQRIAREATRMKALTPLLAVLALVAFAVLAETRMPALFCLRCLFPMRPLQFSWLASATAWCAGHGPRCRFAFPPRAASRSRCPGSSLHRWTTPAPAGARSVAWRWKFSYSVRSSETTAHGCMIGGWYWAKTDILWLGALAFHWSLLVILLRHLRLLIQPVPDFVECALSDWTAFFRLELPRFISPMWSIRGGARVP